MAWLYTDWSSAKIEAARLASISQENDMEKAVADLMQWCLDEAAQVSIDALDVYGIELEAEEQGAIADAIFLAMGAAFRRAGKSG